MSTPKLWHCQEHRWSADYPCPECHANNDQRELQLEMTALGCVNVALELARTDDGAPLSTQLIAQYAYDLAEAMLAERARRSEEGNNPQAARVLKSFKEFG